MNLPSQALEIFQNPAKLHVKLLFYIYMYTLFQSQVDNKLLDFIGFVARV